MYKSENSHSVVDRFSLANPEIATGKLANLDIVFENLNFPLENLAQRLCLRRQALWATELTGSWGIKSIAASHGERSEGW